VLVPVLVLALALALVLVLVLVRLARRRGGASVAAWVAAVVVVGGVVVVVVVVAARPVPPLPLEQTTCASASLVFRAEASSNMACMLREDGDGEMRAVGVLFPSPASPSSPKSMLVSVSVSDPVLVKGGVSMKLL